MPILSRLGRAGVRLCVLHPHVIGVDNMIEGIIIIAVIAFIAMFALINTTVYAAIAGFFDAAVASVMGILTGTTTLLTAWWYWAFDMTNYVGLFWLSMWAILLAYTTYEIALSKQDRGWKNAVGRGSNYLGLALLIMLLAQPIAVSYGTTYLSGTTAFAEIDYNVTTQMIPDTTYYITVQLTNATTAYFENQAMVYDNDTKEVIAATLDFDTVTSPTAGGITLRINSTILSKLLVTKVTIDYFYVGTGNITKTTIANGISPYAVVYDFTDAISYSGNATLTWLPEPFEGQLLKTIAKMDFKFVFADSSHLPTDGGYFSCAVHFYTTSTILSQDTIMFYLALAMATLNMALFVYLSKLYKHLPKVF